MRDGKIQKIKEIILKVAEEMNVEIDKIILFGSRAKGNYTKYSDYDILIVTKSKLRKEIEKKVESEIRKNFGKLLLPADIFFADKRSFNEYKNIEGCIFGIAEREGRKI